MKILHQQTCEHVLELQILKFSEFFFVGIFRTYKICSEKADWNKVKKVFLLSGFSEFMFININIKIL